MVQRSMDSCADSHTAPRFKLVPEEEMLSFFDDLDEMKVGWFLGLKQVMDEDIRDVQETVDGL
jgi:hypothetical protein